MTTPPDLPALTLETLWGILKDELEDEVVNALVWHHLGYRYDSDCHSWRGDDRTLPAPWGIKYPQAPNFIESRPATVQLTRSIPAEHKQLLKEVLGFKGYTVDQLVPRLTRRATMANWLLGVMKTQGLI